MMNNHTAKRKTRSQMSKPRTLELGNYLIVTDTVQTEKNYLEGLHNSLPIELQSKIRIKVSKAKTSELVKSALEISSKSSQFSEIWIVLDRDRVRGFDRIVSSAEDNGIKVGWSNPCIEIWFHAYFDSMPSDFESTKCVSNFRDIYHRKTKREYKKAEGNIYALLNRYGNENVAIEYAKNRLKKHISDGHCKPSEMCPSTTLYQLVEEIKDRVNK